MKITICGSMQFHKDMLEAKAFLEVQGHTVFIPSGAYDISKYEFYASTEEEKITFKIENNLIREHFQFIQQSDAVIVLNYEKKGIPGYIGGNTFLEIGYAFGLGKKIYLMNPVPTMDYAVEMHSMKPVVIDGDLGKIG